VLVQSDGNVVAKGMNQHGQCSIPPLEEGMSYAQASAGGFHTVLLRQDGNAVACGDNEHGQCNIPVLEEGLSYVQVSAGTTHTVLLRSDGHAVAFGKGSEGQCDIPSLAARRYVSDHSGPFGKDLVLQLDFILENLQITCVCSSLAGEEKLQVKVHGDHLASNLHQRIASDLGIKNPRSLRLVLPDGQILTSVYTANPATTVEMLIPFPVVPAPVWLQLPGAPGALGWDIPAQKATLGQSLSSPWWSI
jgi:hypothetical protein